MTEYVELSDAIEIIKKSRQYVESAGNKAEARHDNYGEYYMDHEMWEIMQETEKLLKEIDEIVSLYEKI